MQSRFASVAAHEVKSDSTGCTCQANAKEKEKKEKDKKEKKEMKEKKAKDQEVQAAPRP